LARDLTITNRNIQKHAIRQLDFASRKYLLKPKEMDKLLSRCAKIPSEKFKTISITNADLFGKKVYKIKTFEHELALRLIAQNIKKITGVRQTNRNSIVKALMTLLEDGGDYSIFKFDLKSFYESVNTDDFVSSLERDRGFSSSHLDLIESFFSVLKSKGINGLPRGLAISATIAEYVLRKMDRDISQDDGVFFYQRFVDDMIIVAHPEKTLRSMVKLIKKELPIGLSLNKHKTKHIRLNEPVLKNNEVASTYANFDFLGYSFQVGQRQRQSNNTILRNIVPDISNSKTNKIKTRIVKSLIQFNKDKAFEKLVGRLKVLSGNYTIYDHGRKVKRKSGINFFQSE